MSKAPCKIFLSVSYPASTLANEESTLSNSSPFKIISARGSNPAFFFFFFLVTFFGLYGRYKSSRVDKESALII